jgi:hypothetical protein
VKRLIKTLVLCLLAPLACDEASGNLNKTDPGGQLIVSPERLDFPETSLGSGSSADLVIQNKRGSGATIDVITIEGNARSSFSVSPNSVIKIGAQRSTKITILFTPQDRGELRAELVLFHNVPNLEPLRVILTGRGAQCLDLDQDGFGEDCIPGPDCNDDDMNIHPGATETCDGIDNNCNIDIDEGLMTRDYYRDEDGDRFGNDDIVLVACLAPAGYVEVGGDCNDQDQENYPGGMEICDGQDNNCNDLADEGLRQTYYLDSDGDTYGVDTATVVECEKPMGYAERGGDCNDGDSMNFPGNPEICDDKDNNCNEQVDEGLRQTYYLDGDGDTYGVDTTTISACQMPMGYASRGGDCDDRYTVANPLGTEVCTGGIDEDCDGLIDAADPDCNIMPTSCNDQNDCGGLNAAGQVCPMIGANPELCAQLCRSQSDCTGAGLACRPLPGSASLGFCQAATGVTPTGASCTTAANCADGVCVQNQCRSICQAQRDCGGNEICGVALYNTVELGGRSTQRLTTVCRPTGARVAIGGSCLINASNADTGLCATEHCDLPPWSYAGSFGSSGPATCAAVCTNVDDCGAGQVCGLVYNGLAESPVLQSTGEGAGRYYEAVLGCYTPYYRTSAALGTWAPYPAGSDPIGSACNPVSNTQAQHTCRSRLCAVSPLPNVGQCTRYCQSDNDCSGTLTPSWRCRWGDKNLTGIFVQSYDIADATKFTLLGICAP